jgi:hypothetical protein
MWPADRDGPRQQRNKAQGWRSDWNSWQSLPAFMRSWQSTWSLDIDIETCPQPAESHLQSHTIILVHFNIILCYIQAVSLTLYLTYSPPHPPTSNNNNFKLIIILSDVTIKYTEGLLNAAGRIQTFQVQIPTIDFTTFPSIAVSLKLSTSTVVLLFILRISLDYSNKKARSFHYQEMLIYTFSYQHFIYFLASLFLFVSTEVSPFSVHLYPSKSKQQQKQIIHLFSPSLLLLTPNTPLPLVFCISSKMTHTKRLSLSLSLSHTHTHNTAEQ